jgi:hypothetical protein
MGLLPGNGPHQCVLIDGESIAFRFALANVGSPSPLGEGTPHPVIRPGVWAVLQNLETIKYGSLLGSYRRSNAFKVPSAVKQAGVDEPALGQTAQHNESKEYP